MHRRTRSTLRFWEWSCGSTSSQRAIGELLSGWRCAREPSPSETSSAGENHSGTYASVVERGEPWHWALRSRGSRSLRAKLDYVSGRKNRAHGEYDASGRHRAQWASSTVVQAQTGGHAPEPELSSTRVRRRGGRVLRHFQAVARRWKNSRRLPLP